MPRYSVVIHPPEPVIQEVALLKQQLYEKIGWYHSCHSQAHLTINLFSASEKSLPVWENYVANYTKHTTAFEVSFDKVMNFSNGAWVLLPDEYSYQKLRMLMKDFLRHIPASAFGKSSKPHISIARKLNPEQAEIAKQLLTDVDIQFSCDNLTLRKFNPERGQYDLHKQFIFGEPNANASQ